MIWMRPGLQLLRRLRRGDRRGTVAPLIGVSAVVLFGSAGLAVDVGHAFVVKSALQASTDAAALAGAQVVGTGTAAQAIAAATTYSAVAGNNNATAAINASMVSGYPMVTCLASTGITCGGPSGANAVQVKQQASVPTTFAGVLGFKSFTVSATATASASGGYETPHDVMVVIDTTQSMTSTDPNCGIATKANPNPTRIDCAKAGLQTILTSLAPTKDHIGLMIFPGLTAATPVSTEYDTLASTPTQSQLAYYKSSPAYQIVPLDSTYRASDGDTSLDPTDPLVQASGGVAGYPGISAIGGRRTYFVDVINQAQSVLATTGRANTQKVIIFLGDGDSNATATTDLSSTSQQYGQCQHAIDAAKAATAAGTWVYSLAYNVSKTGCTYDSGLTPCDTMTNIASDPTRFYSDNSTSTSGKGTTGGCISTANSLVGLLNAFQAIAQSLMPARLLPDGTT